MTTSTSPTSSGSSADVTSSKSITCGAIISARAIATRCCWPPESWCGCWCAFSGSPTRVRAARAPAPPPRSRGSLRIRRAASVRLSITFRCGNRLNCWKTIPIRCRTAETSVPLRGDLLALEEDRGRSSSGSSRLMQRSSVLLPLPLGPMTTSTSPASTCRSMPSSTRLSPNSCARPAARPWSTFPHRGRAVLQLQETPPSPRQSNEPGGLVKGASGSFTRSAAR